MIILLVNNGDRKDEFYKEILSDFIEDEGIVSVNNIEEAKEFIINHLEKGGGYIDAIISNYSFYKKTETAYDLKIWLSDNLELSYFQGLLQLNSVPFILVYTESGGTLTDSLLGFDRVLYADDLNNSYRVKHIVGSVIKSWVSDLMGDYELIKVDPFTPFFYMPILWRSDCEVLTRKYSQRPLKLPFLTFRRDIEATEMALDEFYKTVEKISKSSKPKQEKKYHELLKRFPEFILGNTYDQYFYENNFTLPSDNSKNYEPDFIRRHKFYKFNKSANLLEIKLPNERYLTKREFHPTFSSGFVKSISQVWDYQEYFEDESNKNNIVKNLGYFPRMTHSLLLGRTSERDLHLEILEKRLRRLDLHDITLITYDDLIKQRAKLLNYRQLYLVN